MNPKVYKDAVSGRLRDRGMVKWKPFASIPEQHIGLHGMLENLNKVEKPILGEDQMNEINEALQEAVRSQRVLLITYYKGGYIVKDKGMVSEVNMHRGTLVFVDDIFDLYVELPLSELLGVQVV
ncbi:3-oxoacyl-ACP synthase [Priestia megaterium]|nr:3-oxoacyl-ACP synthase [Priestia megaterium]